MDYKDYQAAKSDFWFRAKKDLLFVLMNMVVQSVADNRPVNGYRRDDQSPQEIDPLQNEKLKILNIGAGTGDDLEVLAGFGDVFVADLDPEVLALVPKELCVDIRAADICSLPYEDSEFDAVVSLDVFEHINDDVKAVAEVWRVLKPGGCLVFGVPAFQWLWSARDAALEHKRRYNKHMLMKLFSAFSSNYLNYWNFVLFVPVVLQRLFMRNAKPRVESIQLSRPLNTFLYHLMSVDTFCVKHRFPLPFGISLVGWCRK